MPAAVLALALGAPAPRPWPRNPPPARWWSTASPSRATPPTAPPTCPG
ncbi:hypothetical protein HML84_00265 [Alcanivorax sp. IO_7]|nr:hypothetical protein HML84_00265 [Alcanivorax sp. IO_7]